MSASRTLLRRMDRAGARRSRKGWANSRQIVKFCQRRLTKDGRWALDEVIYHATKGFRRTRVA